MKLIYDTLSVTIDKALATAESEGRTVKAIALSKDEQNELRDEISLMCRFSGPCVNPYDYDVVMCYRGIQIIDEGK